MYDRLAVSLCLLVGILIFVALLACSPDDAVNAGTDCDETCPVGASKTSVKQADGECDADGDFNPVTGAGGLGGKCVGSGSCQVVCLYPECAPGQDLIITAEEFRCETAAVCEGVDCSGHGYCRDNNGQAQCVCDDGYQADGTACIPNSGYTCEDYCQQDHDCFGTDHYPTVQNCLTDCLLNFTPSQKNCAEYSNCQDFAECIGDSTDDDATDDDATDDDATDDDATDDDATDDDATDDDDDDDDDVTPPDGMVYIPDGNFWMGCEPDDPVCGADESPRHEIFVSAYFIDIHEVTNESYSEFLTQHGNYCGGAECVDAGASSIRVHEDDGVWSADSGREDHPMVEVTWYGAKSYCEAQSGRLPTEAEWEKAAKGAVEHFIFPWGDNWVVNAANWENNDDPWEEGDYPLTTPVGYFDGSDHGGTYQTVDGRSPAGVHDMAGNVWEWVKDFYGQDYYQSSPASDPQGPATGTDRVFRGGGADNYYDNFLRTSSRHSMDPTDSDHNTGFRCVQALE